MIGIVNNDRGMLITLFFFENSLSERGGYVCRFRMAGLGFDKRLVFPLSTTDLDSLAALFKIAVLLRHFARH